MMSADRAAGLHPIGRPDTLPLSHRIVLAGGWSRRVVALLAGASGALAMAPIGFFPVMAVSLTVAVWLIDGSDRANLGATGRRRHLWPSMRSAFGAGWWWGFGYFVAGLFWIGSAFLVEADQYAWALPFGVLGLPAVLAVYPACAFAVARAAWVPGAGRLLVLAFALGLSEWMRGILFTGFPWNDLGMTLGTNLVLAQAASLVGLQGLTILTILIFAAPATLADRAGAWDASGRSRPPLVPILLAAVALAAVAGYGAARLASGHVGVVQGVKLRIMQPNVLDDDDFSYANKTALLQDYLTLSDGATSDETGGLSDVTHLIWPESPFPFILSRDPEALGAIAAALPKDGVLVTGAARLEGKPGSPTNPPHYFNAIEVVGKDGLVVDDYDKVHLVPFGEYVPFASLLGRLGISQFVHIPGGFDAGLRQHLLRVPGLPPITPAVCYEAIFSGGLLPRSANGPEAGAILNVSNDSWFGRTAGPYQHLAQARLRSIEEGLPLIRAANTGISAIVDPYGRILESLPLGQKGVLDGFLPKSIEPTFFAEWFRVLPPMTLCLLLTGVFIVRYGGKRRYN